jgi:hypothetical protein
MSEGTSIIKSFELDWLIKNRVEREFYSPQPVATKNMQCVFIGDINEYINSDFNIWNLNRKAFPRQTAALVQLFYPYCGNDDRKIGKEVIALYTVLIKGTFTLIRREW